MATAMYVEYGSWIRDAPIVVVADLVDGGSKGSVVIRPILWLRGSLPVDVDGLYSFVWKSVPSDGRPGVWLFDAEGRPITHDLYVERVTYPIRDAVLYDEFPAEAAAEQRRALQSAELVVEVVDRRGDPTDPTSKWIFAVSRLVHGDGSVKAGDEVTVQLPDDDRINFLARPSELWALQRSGDVWEPVPTWLPLGQSCQQAGPAAAELFPNYTQCAG